MKEIQAIQEKLSTIQEDLNFIKEHMLYTDDILTQEEEKILKRMLRKYLP